MNSRPHRTRPDMWWRWRRSGALPTETTMVWWALRQKFERRKGAKAPTHLSKWKKFCQSRLRKRLDVTRIHCPRPCEHCPPEISTIMSLFPVPACLASQSSSTVNKRLAPFFGPCARLHPRLQAPSITSSAFPPFILQDCDVAG